MSGPLVSILIPCHNAAPWVADTLRSVQAQSWRHWEILLVDDGSTDASLDTVRRFESSSIKVLTQENRGQSTAFNLALAQAQGAFFEYLDADDLLHPDKLRLQIERLAREDPRCVASGEWSRFHQSTAEAAFTPEPLWRDLKPIDWLVEAWTGGTMMHGAAWLVPAAVARAAGPWAEDLTRINDFDYFSRVLLQSSGVAFCPGARSYYRSGIPDSVSDSKSPKAWTSAYDALSRGTALLLSREDSPRSRRAAATTFQTFAHQACPFAPDLVRRAEERVAQLGGCQHTLRAGPLFNLVSRCLGWKTARRLQHLRARLSPRIHKPTTG